VEEQVCSRDRSRGGGERDCVVGEFGTEAVYDGRSLDELLNKSSYLSQAYWELASGVKELKGEAVPYLVHVLKNEPTISQRVYQKLFRGVPRGIKQRFPAPSFYQNRLGTCASMLGWTGKDGVAQIPFLARVSREDRDSMVRLNAMGALERLGPGSEYESMAVEALIAATRETEVRLAQGGYGGLGVVVNRATEVVPILLRGLENPAVRDECIYSLKRLGRAAEPLVQAAIARGEVLELMLYPNAFSAKPPYPRPADRADEVIEFDRLF
jgi:hypothetical protein